MKIEINKIPQEGLTIEEERSHQDLDLETQEVSFSKPVKLRAFAAKITNTVTVEVEINAEMQIVCGRCLKALSADFKRRFRTSHIVDNSQLFIDLDPEIREEMILNYPLKTLCKPECKGLCPSCGTNLNEKKCTCSV